MTKGIDCTLLPGHMRDACIAANRDAGQDEHGNPVQGAPAPSGGSSSFFGIPIPSSAWYRHMIFRSAEVIVGIAMVIVGVKALATSGDTTKVIVSGAKKVGKQI